jgi:8-oxo-dGTP pyrophosphatase MutT (NUDIX family)
MLLSPTTAATDLVVARALVERHGRVLLVRRAAWDTFPSHWELPGGKVDAHEPVDAALARELVEETGLAVDGEARLAGAHRMRSPSGRAVEERVYRVNARGMVELSDEHDDYLWWRGELPGPLTPVARNVLSP